jgi:hypothetical protein
VYALCTSLNSARTTPVPFGKIHLTVIAEAYLWDPQSVSDAVEKR